MLYFLGVDIGTTSTKAIAFSETGEVIADFSFSYEMFHPKEDWSEQDAGEIFNAVIKGINKVIEHLTPHLPQCISFSSAMHSLIAIAEDGKLLTNCIIWADNRSNIIADELRCTNEGQKFYNISGVPVHSMSPLCKLLWLKQNRPEVFTAAHKFIGIKEYIFYKLFNQFIVDTSIASATGLLCIHTLEWSEDILQYAGLSPSKLSNVVSTKHFIYYENSFPALTLTKKIPFVIGASDGALSNLGTGAIDSNTMAVTIGTSGAARMVVDSPLTDSQMRTFCYHIKDELFIAGGANNNGAVVLQWLKESLLQTDETYDQLFQLAEAITPGSNELVFLPYILGERAPIWNANAKGVFFGLNIQHTQGHLIRSALEGVIYSMNSIIKTLTDKHHVTQLNASGGFARSNAWVQILADVSNIKVVVSDTVESSGLGAVMLGAEALGFENKFKQTVSATFYPNSQNQKVYMERFKKFERLYELLKGEMVD